MEETVSTTAHQLTEIDVTLSRLAKEKAEFAKAKQFREAGAAKKEIEAAVSTPIYVDRILCIMVDAQYRSNVESS